MPDQRAAHIFASSEETMTRGRRDADSKRQSPAQTPCHQQYRPRPNHFDQVRPPDRHIRIQAHVLQGALHALAPDRVRSLGGIGNNGIDRDDFFANVPQVSCGWMASAFSVTTRSNCAPGSECSVRQWATARSQVPSRGENGRPHKYSIVVSSTATKPIRAPPSMAMLHRLMRPSMLRPRMARCRRIRWRSRCHRPCRWCR